MHLNKKKKTFSSCVSTSNTNITQCECCSGIFFFILRYSLYVSGIGNCLQRFQTSKCSSLLARIRLTENLIFDFEALSFHPKVTLISNGPISLLYQEVATIYYHHCYYGISINSFHCGLRKHFVETRRKMSHVSIQTYGRKIKLNNQ